MKTQNSENNAGVPSASHTPGPWQARHISNPDSLEDSLIIESTARRYPASYSSPSWGTIAEVFSVGNTLDTATPAANARLIAAAPDLLAALKAKVADGANDSPAVWQQIEDAIAKAEGRA